MVDDTPGLRKRKKAQTRAALGRAAWQLTLELGYSNVRVEDIAAAANVSPRTFNNYFASKDDALLSVGADRGARMAAALRDRPQGEDLWEALAHAVSEQYAAEHELSREVARQVTIPPDLAVAQRLMHAAIRAELAEAIAARIGADATRDLYPRLAGEIVVGATETAFDFWRKSDLPIGFPGFLHDVLLRIAAGMAYPFETR